MTILVTAPLGKIGQPVVQGLLDAGQKVRVTVRTGEQAATLRDRGVDAQVADLTQSLPPSLFADVTGALLITPVDAGMTQTGKALNAAAQAAGVRHVVRVSILSDLVARPTLLGQWHGQIDAHLHATGLTYTILRPIGFMQNLLGLAEMAQQGGISGATSDGGTAFIDARDIAASALAALLTPTSHSRIVDLTGPQALSYADVAAMLGQLTGRSIDFVDTGVEAMRSQLLGAGMPQWLVDTLASEAGATRSGTGLRVTDGVQQLTGQPPRTTGAFLREHLAAFT